MQMSKMLATVVCTYVAGAASAPSSNLLQTWQAGAFAASGATKDTPITRVVGLLKEMSATLEKEQKEDEELYDKLACWCNNNEYEKDEAMEASQAKIADLNSTINELTAKSSELTAQIKTLEEDAAKDKEALAEATGLREKELKEFHGSDLDSTQAIENLKAAIEVLGKHQGSSFPQLTHSLLQTGKAEPWTDAHESSHRDTLLRSSCARTVLTSSQSQPIKEHFLQADDRRASSSSSAASGWSTDDAAVVRVAMRSASAFVQRRHSSGYYPSYTSQSGEIMGVLEQLKEEMVADLGEAQKLELERATNFAELRAAKESEIANGEAMAEKKEDQ